MKTKGILTVMALAIVVALIGSLAMAQQTTGTPGTPSATTTND